MQEGKNERDTGCWDSIVLNKRVCGIKYPCGSLLCTGGHGGQKGQDEDKQGYM